MGATRGAGVMCAAQQNAVPAAADRVRRLVLQIASDRRVESGLLLLADHRHRRVQSVELSHLF